VDKQHQPNLPWGVSLLMPRSRAVSPETIQILERLLGEARKGTVSGLALVVLQADGRFDLHLRGCATEERNQMGVAGMLAALQKMVLELH
jgi:hypothetical protein